MESGTNPCEHRPLEDYLFLIFCIASCIQFLMFFDFDGGAIMTIMLAFNAIIPVVLTFECSIDELIAISYRS